MLGPMISLTFDAAISDEMACCAFHQFDAITSSGPARCTQIHRFITLLSCSCSCTHNISHGRNMMTMLICVKVTKLITVLLLQFNAVTSPFCVEFQHTKLPEQWAMKWNGWTKPFHDFHDCFDLWPLTGRTDYVLNSGLREEMSHHLSILYWDVYVLTANNYNLS